MSEGLKEHAWKACIRESVSWVRIPLSPFFLLFSSILKISIHKKSFTLLNTRDIPKQLEESGNGGRSFASPKIASFSPFGREGSRRCQKPILQVVSV